MGVNFACVYMCSGELSGPLELEVELVVSCHVDGCWNLSPSPLQEQQMVLTTSCITNPPPFFIDRVTRSPNWTSDLLCGHG